LELKLKFLFISAITALVSQGDEVVVIEPFYDCYLPQTQFSGGKLVGVPLIPPKHRNNSEFKLNYSLDENNYYNSINDPNLNLIKDEWKIDYDLLRSKINSKTKLLIINTPNNPTGKILSEEDLDLIIDIVKDYPNLYILSDEVYEHMIFDDYKYLPRIATKLFDRTISIMSGGKIFSATGVRVGWAIGPTNLIKQISSVHQYSSFCLFEPIQNTIADCLDAANNPYKGFSNYYEWLRVHYANRRNFFINQIPNIHYFKDSNFFVPEGGYFAVLDISGEKVENIDYGFEEDNIKGENNKRINYTKDYNFLFNMANNKKVVGIPLTPFYTEENKHLGQKYIRLAFCKEVKTITTAFERLSN